MRRTARTARGIALCGVLASAALASGAAPVAAGCQVEITYKNVWVDEITTYPPGSRVKIKNGWYKRLGPSAGVVTVPAGGQRVRTYNLDFGCNKDRRYKIQGEYGTALWYQYKPSASGWTRRTALTVNLEWPNPYDAALAVPGAVSRAGDGMARAVAQARPGGPGRD